MNDFLKELDGLVAARLEGVRSAAVAAEPAAGIGVRELLVQALKKELEASEEAALWMTRETDVEVKLALARQCGDEAKHYRLIADRLRALGADPDAIAPLADGYSPMYRFLEGLETTVERVAAGPFAREALAKVVNEVFIAWCGAQQDHETARLYRDVINPDEAHHHENGRRLLERLVKTDEDRARARRAVERTLEIASELQELVRLKKGIARAPGC